MIRIPKTAGLSLLSAIFVGAAAAQDAPAPWVVKDAPIRVTVELSHQPSHQSAGYFIAVPDGGALPGPRPEPVAVDESGAALKSAVLWHCKDTECALVFEAPKAGRTVTLYFRGARQLNLWTPQSGLTPSAILCQINGTRAKAAALKLGELGAVGSNVQFVNQAWSAGTWKGSTIPLAMWERRMDGSAMYILAYIDVKDPGTTWIGPHYRSGEMEVAVNGKMLKQSKKNDKVGGVGASVELSKGLHRLELYGFSSGDRAVGPMMFAWRTPKTTVDQLGGPRADDMKYPGTPMGETHMIDPSYVVKSGRCAIRSIQTQSGPVASFTLQHGSIFAFPGEQTLIAYTLRASTQSNPENTVYTWSIEQAPEALPRDAELTWLFRAGKYTRVSLAAEADGKRATCSFVFYPYSEISSSMDDTHTRQAFKLGCYHMLKSYPEKVDPVANWDDAMWNNFFRVLELKGGNALLEYVVTQRWDFFKKKLSPERKALLQDVFLFSIGPRKPKEAITWARTFSSDEFSSARSAVFKLNTAEVLLYYLDDPAGARNIIAPLLRDSGEAGELARIRMGDLEFLSGNINEATRRYGDVQGRAKAEAQAILPKRLIPIPAGPTRAARTEEPEPKGGGRRAREAQPAEPAFVPMEPPSSVPAWKLGAIRDVAASENVARLIDQEFYLEAFQALRLWERAFPMAKITGDYLLREADLYIHLEDYKRARKILSAYCEQVDVSNFLPEAMNKVKRCMIEMKESDAVIEKFEKEILRRTVFGGGEP